MIASLYGSSYYEGKENMKKVFWGLLPMIILVLAMLTSCDTQNEVFASTDSSIGTPTEKPNENTSEEASTEKPNENISEEESTEAVTEAATYGHEHEFGGWMTYRKATCSAPGEKKRTCACGAYEFQSIPASGEHNWRIFGCDTPKICKDCKEEGEPAGHNWEEATCTKPQTCRRCNETTGSAKGHQYRGENCTLCGITRTYSMGETWIVDGQWEFTVKSITVHSLCNSYANKMDGYTNEQVILIEYTYKNLGYTGAIQDLYISSIAFDVYDEAGRAVKLYACTHEEIPKECVIGTSCTASQAYIMPNNNSKVKLVVEKYTSNGQGEKQATFELAYDISCAATGKHTGVGTCSECGINYFNVLADVIAQKGKLNESGSAKYIQCVNKSNYKISLLYTNAGKIEINLTSTINDGTYSFYLHIDQTTGQYRYSSTMFDLRFNANYMLGREYAVEGVLSAKDFTKDTTSLPISKATVKNIATSATSNMSTADCNSYNSLNVVTMTRILDALDDFLAENSTLNLANFGFTNYSS